MLRYHQPPSSVVMPEQQQQQQIVHCNDCSSSSLSSLSAEQRDDERIVIYNNNSNTDNNNTINMPLLNDQLEALLLTERDYIVQHIPCISSQHRRRPVELEEWRRKICQWSYRVIDHFQLDREVVAIGMNIFDRFLIQHKNDPYAVCPCPSCKRILDSRTYQLAAMTSLYISIKLNTDFDHTTKRTFKLHSFVELSRGQFISNDILHMESIMLSTIQWKVHPPTPILFISYMIQTLMPNDNTSKTDLVLHVLRELSRYLSELAICLGRECSGKPPSHIAFAAILSAMDLLTIKALPICYRDVFISRVCSVLNCKGPDTNLISILQKTLWPELLFDTSNDNNSSNTNSTTTTSSEQQHPISMARDFGLLDVDRLYGTTRSNNITSSSSSSSSPPVSPKRLSSNISTASSSSSGQGSPVSVNR